MMTSRWTPNFDNLTAPETLKPGYGQDTSSGDYQSYANSLSNAAYGAQNRADHTEYNRVKSALDSADADAELGAADSMAAANRETASRTGALALQLATARRAPGGGIRQGIRRKGFSAASAGYGLNRANASDRLAKAKKAGRARVASRYSAEAASKQEAYDNYWNAQAATGLQPLNIVGSVRR